MTTTQRRRGRRSLAAILAAMLMASVLAVVAGSPAHAANTSNEVLVDHDGNASTDKVREFGGRDRYDTAVRLAKNFAKGKGGLGNVPIAFVASGNTLVDAVSVSGLAGYLDAPVLLTPTGDLHGGVADYIEDYGVDTVRVLGGSAAVADSVLEEIEALANGPKVTRIQGENRYATAAAIASELRGDGTWCGGEDAAAILVNGGDASLIDAISVGPIANRLLLPVLMTAVGELPNESLDFIEAEDIEHVVIVGGTDAVSEDVESALTEAGVDTITRVAGDTPAATSVELAAIAGSKDCDQDLTFSPDTVALVHRDALPDGVAAAPVLANTLKTNGMVPILVVGDTLPASVRDYLAATPSENSAGKKVNLEIVAIGGTAAVSTSVMEAAIAAAASADALTAKIGNWHLGTSGIDTNGDGRVDGDDVPLYGGSFVRLYFSDNVINDTGPPTGQLTAAIRDTLEINGALARLAETPIAVPNTDDCIPDKVVVNLASPLKPGDVISVVGGTKIGVKPDQRTVGAASVTVPARGVDRVRPVISVTMIEGGQALLVVASELSCRCRRLMSSGGVGGACG